MSALKNVRLYGHLGKRFGRNHQFYVKSPVEAIAALKANYPDFQRAMTENGGLGCRVFMDFEELRPDQLGHPFGRETIRVVPVVAGAGTGAEFIIADMIWYAASMYATNALFAMAVNYLVMTAVSSLLSPSPKNPSVGAGGGDRPDNKPSYVFNGAVNTSAQGNPIAVGYGRLRIGSQVINAGLAVEQINV